MLFNRHTLTELRKAQGLTKSALAEAARTSVPYISQLESGSRSAPGPKLMRDLCAALSIDDPRALYLEPTVDELIGELEKARAREVAA